MNKTIEKLRAICAPHGVEVDAHRIDTDWHIVFDAPPKMCWGASQATVVVYNWGTLRGVVGFIESELAEGFYPADDEALRITGQLDDGVEL